MSKKPSATGTETGKKISAVAVLGYLRDDVRELEHAATRRRQNKAPLALVAKADVLQCITDWIEYCQENK